jgi:hypothetical protein
VGSEGSARAQWVELIPARKTDNVIAFLIKG